MRPNFREESDKTCIDCGKPIKQSLIVRNPDACRDYVCHQVHKGIDTMKIIHRLNGTPIGETIINFKDRQHEQQRIYKHRTSR